MLSRFRGDAVRKEENCTHWGIGITQGRCNALKSGNAIGFKKRGLQGESGRKNRYHDRKICAYVYKPANLTNETKAKNHSIIVFSKYPEKLNTWIERGFSINYEIYRTERYTTRAQLTQCFNCYGYDIKTCQAKTCCGKRGESHKTQS